MNSDGEQSSSSFVWTEVCEALRAVLHLFSYKDKTQDNTDWISSFILPFCF